MGLRGRVVNEQLAGDFGVGQPPCQQPEYLLLAGTQGPLWQAMFSLAVHEELAPSIDGWVHETLILNGERLIRARQSLDAILSRYPKP